MLAAPLPVGHGSHSQGRGHVCLHAQWSVAAPEPGCSGHVTLGYFFFLFEVRFSRGSSWKCKKPEDRTDFSDVVSVTDPTNQTKQPWLTSWMWPSGTEQEFPTVLKCLYSVLLQMLLNVGNVSKLCSLSHCASLQLNWTCRHYQCTLPAQSCLHGLK